MASAAACTRGPVSAGRATSDDLHRRRGVERLHVACLVSDGWIRGVFSDRMPVLDIPDHQPELRSRKGTRVGVPDHRGDQPRHPADAEHLFGDATAATTGLVAQLRLLQQVAHRAGGARRDRRGGRTDPSVLAGPYLIRRPAPARVPASAATFVEQRCTATDDRERPRGGRCVLGRAVTGPYQPGAGDEWSVRKLALVGPSWLPCDQPRSHSQFATPTRLRARRSRKTARLAICGPVMAVGGTGQTSAYRLCNSQRDRAYPTAWRYSGRSCWRAGSARRRSGPRRGGPRYLRPPGVVSVLPAPGERLVEATDLLVACLCDAKVRGEDDRPGRAALQPEQGVALSRPPHLDRPWGVQPLVLEWSSDELVPPKCFVHGTDQPGDMTWSASTTAMAAPRAS